MSTRFFVSGQLPGLNEIIEACKGSGGKGLKYSRMKKQWTEHVCWCAKAALVPKATRVSLLMEWIEPTHKNGATRDPDNVHAGEKFLWDGLKLAKVIPDDKSANNAGSEHLPLRYGPKPGVWVTVTPEEA